MMLRAEDVRVRLAGTPILQGVSLSVAPGEVVALLGPNGAGKSTLLATLSGTLAPHGGRVTLDGKPLASWEPGALARRRAVLAQHSPLSFPFRVIEVALLGRSPHAGRSRRQHDLAVTAACLRETAVTHLADRIYTTLSGGERQRVHVARALAQIDFASAGTGDVARYLLLDEPTSSLDLAHQHATLATARRAAAAGMGVLAFLHDPNLAAMHADRIAVLSGGRVVADGAPAEALTEAIVGDTYGMAVRIDRHPTRGCPLVVAV